MRSGKLSSRLSRIRETQKAGATANGPGATERDVKRVDQHAVSKTESIRDASGALDARVQDPAERPLAGWNLTGEHLFERTVRSYVSGFRRALSPHFPLLFPREREDLAVRGDLAGWLDRIVFFDLETTGLSHGTGTVAFMAAIGRLDTDGGVSITQILIDDYPGEPAFLARFEELAGHDPVLVSFNGKGFDAQILQTRFLMNAMRPAFLAAPHLDLLYPSRRLWKGELGNCRLGTIESGVFGAPRVDDLPGSEAPDAWFDYLRGAPSDRLLAVGEHNLEDVKTLARLFFELDRRIDEGLGRAALIRALELRSRRDYAGAEAFLSPLADEGDPIASRLLAIDAEHRLEKLDRALALARTMGDQRRAERIEIKLSRRGNRLL